MAVGGFAVAATLAVGVAGAAAATTGPNPGPGTPGSSLSGYTITGASHTYHNNAPTYPGGTVVDGPQTANVPTLAWVGEDVRLVACDPAIAPGPNDQLPEEADWNTENWTGDQAFVTTPTFDGSATSTLIATSGSNSFFAPTDTPENSGKGCTDADIKSLHAGLWQGKLNVYGSSHNILYSEQFIVIWMEANAPVLSESSVNSLSFPGGSTVDQLTSTGVTNATGAGCSADNGAISLSGPWNCVNYLGDPSGNGVFNPDACQHDYASNDVNNWEQSDCNNGLVNIRVTGYFPVEDQPPATTNLKFFGSIDGGTNPGQINLPSQWPQLAALMADSSTVGNHPGANPGLWDIHGGPTNPWTHVSITSNSTPCPADSFGSVLASTDSVNNCIGGDSNFSRLFGDVTTGATATRGPYDDEAPNETLISDGNLNADDAPMPALPVTVSIAANTGGADLGGVGGLYSADKELIYSHDFNGNTSSGKKELGNLYNPYYWEYIPSTSRGYAESSGVNGTAGDDFPGFDLGSTTPYKFWNTLNTSSQDKGGSTACMEWTSDPNDPHQSDYYQMPGSNQPTTVTVYTDERGEAYVAYNPGDNFYLNGLITPPQGSNPNGKISIDEDNACNLQPYLGQPIGTSAISATAQYPYQGVDYPNIPTSNTVVKTVDSLWSKTLTCYPKQDQAGDYISDCITTANNLNGEPFSHELVCFNVQWIGASPGGITPFEGQITNLGTGTVLADTTGEGVILQPQQPFSNFTCEYSNELGEAGVEIQGSEPNVDVNVLYYNEQITRDLLTTLGGGTQSSNGGPSSPTIIPLAVSVPSSGSTGGSSSSSSSVTGGSPLGLAKTAGVCKVQSVHLRSRLGKYTVSFKLSCSSAKSVKVTIRAYRANGKLLRTIRATVATNKAVKVGVGRKVAHITITA